MIAITCLIINLDWILNKQSEMGYRRQLMSGLSEETRMGMGEQDKEEEEVKQRCGWGLKVSFSLIPRGPGGELWNINSPTEYIQP